MEAEERIEKARERVIEALSKNMDLYGVAPSIGRLYGTLYFNEEPMTLDELAQSLVMSKSSMSTGVRTLTDLKMVEKVWKKGERKDLYKVEDDWYQSFIDFFGLKWRKAIKINREAIIQSLAELQQIIKDDDVSEKSRLIAARDIKKLTEALNYYQWLNEFVNTLENHEIFNYIPKPNTSK